METKCVCGHVHKWEEESTSDKNQRFTKIQGNFTISRGDYSNEIKEVTLYACPICKTVHMSEW
jgi:hypothetical protein